MKVIKRRIIETVYQEETNTLENITTEYFFSIHESELSDIQDNLRDNQKLFMPVFLFDTLHHISEKQDLIQALKGQTFAIITTEPIEKP